MDLFINIETGQYPTTIFDIRQDYPNMSLPDTLDDELLTDLGYARVLPTERLVGDVVIEDAPILQPDGTYVQAFHTRAYTPGELAERANSERAKRIRDGFQYTVGDKTLVVQIDDRDFINLLLLKEQASESDENSMFTFRCKDNVNHELTQPQVLALCRAAFDYRRSILVDSWDAKDSVD